MEKITTYNNYLRQWFQTVRHGILMHRVVKFYLE